jgi:hypothetical protein
MSRTYSTMEPSSSRAPTNSIQRREPSLLKYSFS